MPAHNTEAMRVSMFVKRHFKKQQQAAALVSLVVSHQRQTKPRKLKEQEQVEVAGHSVQPNTSHICVHNMSGMVGRYGVVVW
jgi:hypothetical protein